MESMTLLKNDNHLLPLSKNLKHIAVLGPNAKVARYGDYAPTPDPSAHNDLFSAIHEAVPNADLTFADGTDIPAALAQTKSAEVVILAFGERPGISGEGSDRSNLDLPDNQEALLESVIATGKPTVLVLQNGRPLTIAWARDHANAILEAWYPGEFGGRAMAATLFGDNNPGGHLTISFPRSIGVLPDYYNYDPSKNHKYVDGDDRPVFVFGYGLSYTTFRFDALRVEAPKAENENIEVSVNVTNTGAIAGDEVAQLYIRQNVSSVETPERSLKGFTRVHLASAETRTITFQVPKADLALWNADHIWVVEPGAYTIWVGDSSEATLTTTFKIVASETFRK